MCQVSFDYITYIYVHLTRRLKWINQFQIRVKSQGLLNKMPKMRVKSQGQKVAMIFFISKALPVMGL